jgi:hypothetical protein
MNIPAIPIVKTAIAGTSRLKITARTKSIEKEKKNTADVFMVPLTAPFKNKIMGSKKRKSGPMRGTKTAAKTKMKIAGRSLDKGLSVAGNMIFFREDNRLKI